MVVEVLAVTGIGLTGTLPGGVWPNLESLQVRHNAMKGTLPSELSSYTKLEGLTLSKNDFEGPLPDLQHLSAISTCACVYMHLSHSQNLCSHMHTHLSLQLTCILKRILD